MKMETTITEVCKRLQEVPSLKNKVRRLEVALHLSTGREEKAMIEQAILALYHKYFDIASKEAHFSSAQPEKCVGDFFLGEMVRPSGKRQPFYLQKKAMLKTYNADGNTIIVSVPVFIERIFPLPVALMWDGSAQLLPIKVSDNDITYSL